MTSAEAGERLDIALAARLPELSRSTIAAIIREGGVAVDGRAARASQRVRAGEDIEIDFGQRNVRQVEAEEIPLEVVYQDEDIAVLDKPAGLVVHPAPGHWSGTLANAIMSTFPSAVGSADRPGIVHRLDKDTSGLIAIALSARGLSSLHRQISTRQAERRYLALVRGEVRPDAGIVDTPIGRDPSDRKRMATHGVAARPARTHYRVLESLSGLTLIEASLETGRTHQIRVHMAAIHHAVAGDTTYGGPEVPGLRRHFLHAHRLRLRLPSSGEIEEFVSPLPGDLASVLNMLRADSATS